MSNITYRKSIKQDIPAINNLFIEMIKIVNSRMIKEGIEPYLDYEKGYEEGREEVWKYYAGGRY